MHTHTFTYDILSWPGVCCLEIKSLMTSNLPVTCPPTKDPLPPNMGSLVSLFKAFVCVVGSVECLCVYSDDDDQQLQVVGNESMAGEELMDDPETEEALAEFDFLVTESGEGAGEARSHDSSDWGKPYRHAARTP